MPKQVQAEQRTPEWYAARLGRATASRFTDVMATIRSGEAAQRRNYRAELLVERLTGQANDMYTSPAMQWGTDNEPLARLQYELETGNEVVETGFWQHDTLMAGASPDGLISETGLIEIKCPNTATHIETLKKREVPKQYVAQVQGQMWITGRTWCDFVSFDPRLPENTQLIIVRVERDEKYIKELADQVELFLQEVDNEIKFLESYGK